MEPKISFGFKKLSKKSAVIGVKPPEEKKVELIECLDASNIKIIGHVEEVKAPLVIPMQGANKNLLDRIKDVNDLKARSLIRFKVSGAKEKPAEADLRPDSELTIEELAARKLLEEAKNYENKTTTVKVKTIAMEDQLLLEGAKEPSMDDYESVPIGDFGLAMLRGMGWNEQLAEKKKVDAPQLRPKGMGLGASVPGHTKNQIPVDKHGKELKLVKNAKARIIAGKEKGNYCIVQGLDDDSGRIIVKTTLTGSILSLNEFMLFPVSDEEYAKSSKVLNNEKFERYNKKSEENLQKLRDKNTNEDNGDVEYIPNGKNVKIELSSESEGEKKKYKEAKVERKVKLERKSRSRTPDKNRSKVRTIQRNERHRSSSGDPDKQMFTNSRDKSKHLRKSRSPSHRRRSRSRSQNRHRHKSNRRKDSEGSDASCSEELNKRDRKKKKSKKSKKHNKEKKSKKDRKSRHRSSSGSESNSSDSEDDRDSSRRRR